MTIPKPKKHKQRFEHRISPSVNRFEDLMGMLWEAENDGWELVSPFLMPSGNYILFFKRPV